MITEKKLESLLRKFGAHIPNCQIGSKGTAKCNCGLFKAQNIRYLDGSKAWSD